MIREAEIQQRLEEMIRDGTLYERIAGKEALRRAEAGHSSGTSASVLASLEQVDLISTGRHNISSDRGERLFPDLVLASKKSGHIVVVEVKRDDQSVRLYRRCMWQHPWLRIERFILAVLADRLT